MIGMHVADDHGRQVRGFRDPLQAADHALTGIEQQPRPAPLEEIA